MFKRILIYLFFFFFPGTVLRPIRTVKIDLSHKRCTRFNTDVFLSSLRIRTGCRQHARKHAFTLCKYNNAKWRLKRISGDGGRTRWRCRRTHCQIIVTVNVSRVSVVRTDLEKLDLTHFHGRVFSLQNENGECKHLSIIKKKIQWEIVFSMNFGLLRTNVLHTIVSQHSVIEPNGISYNTKMLFVRVL